MKLKLLAAAGLILASMTGQSFAAPVTFFGEDLNGPPNNDPTPAVFTNATNARNNFFTNLTGVGTETFESYLVIPPSVSFGAAGTATLTGGALASGNDTAGRYPVSGSQYLILDTGNFSLSFSSPIAAFGFFATDVGDFGAHLTLELTDSLDNVSVLILPNTAGTDGDTSGSNFYFGFFDTGNTYKQIVFNSDAPSAGSDIFGFDDFSIGSPEQVTPGVIPLPAALPLFATGLGALGLLAWRRKRTKAAAPA